jgi:hypothetical protein
MSYDVDIAFQNFLNCVINAFTLESIFFFLTVVSICMLYGLPPHAHQIKKERESHAYPDSTNKERMKGSRNCPIT